MAQWFFQPYFSKSKSAPVPDNAEAQKNANSAVEAQQTKTLMGLQQPNGLKSTILTGRLGSGQIGSLGGSYNGKSLLGL